MTASVHKAIPLKPKALSFIPRIQAKQSQAWYHALEKQVEVPGTHWPFSQAYMASLVL